jgi:anti-sigma-K factor RskA
MTDEPDIDMLAAEYVLGTLPVDERAAVAQRSANDKPLAAAIAAWEKRLAPLAEAVMPQEAPSHVWDRIAARIDGLAGAPSGTIIDFDRRLRRWRTAAIAASALAASLLLFAGYREYTRPEQQKTLVAVLQKDAQSPAFLVSVDLEQKRLTIRAVSAPPHPGKSYELWLVHDDLKTPRSLGVIGEGPFTTVQPKLAAYAPKTIEQATLAVSLEPEGGSPTGAPTGPVLFSGKLIQATQ